LARLEHWNVVKLAPLEHWNVINSVNHEQNRFACNTRVYIIYREVCEISFPFNPNFIWSKLLWQESSLAFF